jgi:hypothetical protein
MMPIKAIASENEIYSHAGQPLISPLAPAEVQTAIVDNFAIKGFTQPVPVCRAEQRFRTRAIANAFILLSDLRGFKRVTEQEREAIERLLDTLDVLIHRVSHQFGGTVLSSVGDIHCLTFAEASQVAAADQLSTDWEEASHERNFDCAINIALHCGRICAFSRLSLGRCDWRRECTERLEKEALNPGGCRLQRGHADRPHNSRRLQSLASSSRIGPRCRRLLRSIGVHFVASLPSVRATVVGRLDRAARRLRNSDRRSLAPR